MQDSLKEERHIQGELRKRSDSSSANAGEKNQTNKFFGQFINTKKYEINKLI